jgi:hypothetical protein
LAKELWGNVDGVKVKSAKVGKGMILSGMEMQEALDLIGVVPDCKFAKEDPALFIHRRIADGEMYFVSNQTDKTITIQPEFRVSGKSPELWSSVYATRRDLPAFTQGAQTTVVPLKLEAFESQFIVFRKGTAKSGATDLSANFPVGRELADLSANWMVTFDAARRGPVNPVAFKSLTDWTVSADESIKFYSGTAVYKTNAKLAEIPSGKKIVLDLGVLTAMAKVKVNGKVVGGVWTAPWQVDITSTIKPGNNEVEISVVNNWMNRLIGDQKMPEAARPTWSPIIPYKADSPLQASGLFGPVKILQFN